MFGLQFRAWAYIGCALAIIGAIVFFEQCAEHRGELRGESKVRSQWNKAIDEAMKATAQAQSELDQSSQKSAEITTEKVVRVRKIVADFSETAHDLKDESALYFAAADSVRRVRVECALGVIDIPAAPNPA